MGGMPEFKFPKDLADCWWKPVENAGMIVTLEKDKPTIEMDQNWGGTIKTIPGHDAGFDILNCSFVKENKTFENGMYSILNIPTMNRQHNRYLMAISRIVVASGARIIDGRYGWKIMYVSQSPIADRVIQSLGEHPQLNLRRVFPGDPLVVEKNGWLVEIVLGRQKARIHFGHGINTKTDAENSYAAIDFQWPRLFGKDHAKELIQICEQCIESSGARRIDDVLPRKREDNMS